MDGIYLRRNWGGEYENVAILVAIAVNEDGFREVLGAAEGMKEDKASWVSFFRWLRGRGLDGHKVELGSDALGNLTRIENELAKLPAKLEATKTRKAEILEQLANAKSEVQKPFAFEDELKEKTDRLNALNIELNLDEKDTPVLDTEPEQSDEPPERKCVNWER